MSEAVGHPKKPEVHRLRTSSTVVKPETRLGAIPERPNVDVFQRIPRSEVPKHRPAHDTPLSKSTFQEVDDYKYSNMYMIAPKAKKVGCLLM